jgi:mannose-6-phosphate isomerase
MPGPQRLTPSLREKIWGRSDLSPFFPNVKEPVGEAWYLADRELPILVKLIFTSERLSVQVHPDDGEDGPRGKTEMWHILEAEPGATIALGFRQEITRQRLVESARTGEIEHLLNWIPVKAGDTYFTPAHTVHAIGGGIVLCEIQQHCDVTYRLYDYGRPRELHLEKAAAISDLGVHPGKVRPQAFAAGHDSLVCSKHFVTESIRLAAGQSHRASAENCHLWICLEGQARIGAELMRPGEVILVPEEEEAAVEAETPSRFLRTFVPH